jgi:hypothetical protein
MADQTDPEVLQILGSQARQYPLVDLVFAEGRLVLLEPELPQPIRDIHRRHAPMIRTRLSVLRFRLTGCGKMPPAIKTVIPAVAKRRAGIQKPLKCLDSRFRGNDETSSNIASFPAVGEFFSTLL